MPTGSARDYAYTAGWGFNKIIENLTSEHIYLNICDSQNGNTYTTPYIVKNSTIKIVYKDGKEGDLNGDGEVNVADHVKLTEIIMNQ